MIRLFFSVFIIIFISACNYNVQTTSGRDYLSQYPSSDTYEHTGAYADIDAEVKTAAAVEPQLLFPARIGIAKVMNGDLASLSQEEMQIWHNVREQLGTQFGEFIPVSPLVAAMVTGQQPQTRRGSSGLYDVIRKIRLGAARQHLDVVLLYEVYGKSARSSNLLSLMDLTIVGAYLSPGQSLSAEGYAKALLLDVRNGYPYGTVEGVATDSSVSTRVGSRARQRNLYEKTALAATAELSDSVVKMFFQLKQSLANR